MFRKYHLDDEMALLERPLPPEFFLKLRQALVTKTFSGLYPCVVICLIVTLPVFIVAYFSELGWLVSSLFNQPVFLLIVFPTLAFMTYYAFIKLQYAICFHKRLLDKMETEGDSLGLSEPMWKFGRQAILLSIKELRLAKIFMAMLSIFLTMATLGCFFYK